ncbi:transporter [Bacteroidia bacterium]|nr:transporter [Bacteroidia bacterium]
MTNFLFSLNVVAPLFVIMTAGYLTRTSGFANDSFFKQLNKIVFNLFLPVMLFQDIRTSYSGDFSDTKLIYSAIIGVVATILVSFLIVPILVKRKGRRGSIIQAVYRSNFLIYGLPIARGMYNDEAVATVSMLMCIVIPLYNVSAVIILSMFSETGKKVTFGKIMLDIARNPLILGCVFGLLGGITHVNLPNMLDIPLKQFASVSAIMALFVMGGEFKFASLRNNIVPVVLVTFARLIVVPVVILTVLVAIGFRDVQLAVLVSLFATPAAMASYIMATNMGNDGQLANQIVVLSTACSCVTIFFIIYFLRSWGYL